jgi:hypothetical protein
METTNYDPRTVSIAAVPTATASTNSKPIKSAWPPTVPPAAYYPLSIAQNERFAFIAVTNTKASDEKGYISAQGLEMETSGEQQGNQTLFRFQLSLPRPGDHKIYFRFRNQEDGYIVIVTEPKAPTMASALTQFRVKKARTLARRLALAGGSKYDTSTRRK